MKVTGLVSELFTGWRNAGKAELLAMFFEDVGGRHVISHRVDHGCGFQDEIPLTVHTVAFSGPPVLGKTWTSKRYTWLDGNSLTFPT